MSNADEAMSPAEFAKLMGAYPQPAENPLPAYGGYMDNSAANFAWVNNNDYFGAESNGDQVKLFYEGIYYNDDEEDEREGQEIESYSLVSKQDYMDYYHDTKYNPCKCDEQGCLSCFLDEAPHTPALKKGGISSYESLWFEDDELNALDAETFEATPKWECDACGDMHDDEDEAESCCIESCDHTGDAEMQSWGGPYRGSEFQMYCNNCGADGYGTFGSIDWSHHDKTLEHEQTAESFNAETFEARWDIKQGHADTAYLIIDNSGSSRPQSGGGLNTFKDAAKKTIDRLTKGVKKYVVIGMNGHYVGSPSGNYIQEFTNKEAAKKHIGGMEAYGPTHPFRLLLEPLDVQDGDYTFVFTDAKLDGRQMMSAESFNAETFEAPYGGAGSIMDIGKSTPLADFTDEELTTSSAIHGDFDQASLNYSGHQNIEVKAEMDIVADGMAVVSNVRDDVVGVVEVIDDEDDDELVEISIQDENMEEIGSFTLDDGMILDDEDNYLAENTIVKEAKKRPVLTSLAAIAGTVLLWPHLKTSASKVFGADVATSTQEVLDNDPELIENPNTGDLDPAQYEELVVESTGYAVDVIPVGLDGGFMGSRFAALPTERYVRYSDPGIGAHTDIALDRDEIYLEPEMAMVQAAEGNVVKETQAPGQSPYNSTTGEENPDFDYRVLKETTVVSLDPAVKPFIPQSMAGYTGNANTPPSVYNKMFNVGVLGQTPAFVPGSGDIGSSHTGSRNAIPNSLGIAGSVGGPLSDKVNANYTDGTTSMSLAQWAIENTVSQNSDTEAVVIDRSSGAMKRVRRV